MFLLRTYKPFLALGVWAVLFCASSAWALGVGTAALPHGGTLYAPGTLYSGLPGPDYYSVYLAPAVPTNYFLVADIIAPHANLTGDLQGTLDSQVWREQTTGELLFAYRLHNSAVSTKSVHTVNIAGGWGNSPQWDIVDTGILAGQGDFPLTFQRYADQVDINFDVTIFVFDPTSGLIPVTVENLLDPGFSTDWMYLQTTALYYRTANATVQNGSSSTGTIATFAPAEEPLIPEPLTVVSALLVVGGVGRYSYKRLIH